MVQHDHNPIFPRSTLLFGMPSWSTGAARVLDIGGMFDEYNTSESPAEADRRALASDWYAVGDDIWGSIETVGQESLPGMAVEESVDVGHPTHA